MDNVSFTMGDIMWILGFIIAGGSVAAIIVKLCTPFRAVKRRLDEVERKQDNDNKRLKSLEEGGKMTQRALLALLDSQISPNDENTAEQLIETRNAMNTYLVNK